MATQQLRKNPGYGMLPLYLIILTHRTVGILINFLKRELVLPVVIREKYEDHLQVFPGSQIFTMQW
jgi:hypothetical protein